MCIVQMSETSRLFSVEFAASAGVNFQPQPLAFQWYFDRQILLTGLGDTDFRVTECTTGIADILENEFCVLEAIT